VIINHIRGGTDGSKLSFMGLPCPNVFNGMQNVHSHIEWVGVEDLTQICRNNRASGYGLGRKG
jgi:tripeptide aminopeptidase